MSSPRVAVNIPLAATLWSIPWLARVSPAENAEISNSTLVVGVRLASRAEGSALSGPWLTGIDDFVVCAVEHKRTPFVNPEPSLSDGDHHYRLSLFTEPTSRPLADSAIPPANGST